MSIDLDFLRCYEFIWCLQFENSFKKVLGFTLFEQQRRIILRKFYLPQEKEEESTTKEIRVSRSDSGFSRIDFEFQEKEEELILGFKKNRVPNDLIK